MDHVLQSRLPSEPWTSPAQRRLPGIQPLDMADWLHVDEAFAGQMALRDGLLATRRAEVLAQEPGAERAAAEVLHLVLDHLGDGYRRDGDDVLRPDGVRVTLDRADPLASAARLVQEDLCILEKPPGGAEHLLTAAALCFPANWTLAEKIGRPLGAIHIPVESYTDDMARRVQRLFDAIRPARPLWRQNALLHPDATLFAPAPERRARHVPDAPPRFLRSERQVLIRLPESGAVLFSIHTYMVPVEALPPEALSLLEVKPVGG